MHPSFHPDMLTRLQALVIDGAGRGAERLQARDSFGLPGLVQSLLRDDSAPRIGLVTGFPIPVGDAGWTFENDGPIGVGHIAIAAGVLGWPQVFVIEDSWTGIVAAIAGVADSLGVPFAPKIVPLPAGEDSAATRARMRSELDRFGLTHLIAVERPGAAQDGGHYSMRADRIDAGFVPSDFLFEDVPWVTAGFADGGNEIGMGRIGVERIATAIAHGATIASRTKTDHLTVCGVSNWGAYGLVALLALAMPEQQEALMARFTPETDRMLFDALASAGAVDGVTRAQTPSVDGIALSVHHDKITAMRALLAEFGGA